MLWLKKPVLWTSSRDAGQWNSTKMTLEDWTLIRSKWHDWYQADWDYAQTTVYLFCATLGVVALLRWGSQLAHGRSGAAQKPGLLDRVAGLAGYITTRQFRVAALNWNSPPVATIGAITGLLVFVLALIFTAKPYYWPKHTMGHSPPLGTRAGWVSIAIMPFMIAFGTKVNFIGLLTRTSHERLQVFHRWTATIMYVTSLIHTFPYIVNNIAWKDMQLQYKTTPWYWTGIAALIPQTWLIACSWGYFRNPQYELFKKLHYIAAAIFMAALFIHCNFRLTSWHYIWATLALYGTSWLVRLVRGLATPATATVRSLPDRTLAVRLAVPARFRWAPGQHILVRFMISPLHFGSTHPFTIANVHVQGKKNEVELIMRVRDGITRALAAREGRSISAWVDGPYGHSGLARELRRFDRVLFLAGGSGTTFTAPLFLDLVAHKADRPADAKAEFVITVRESGALGWLERELQPFEESEAGDAAVRTHVTREKVEDVDIEKEPVSIGSLHHGRPNIPELVKEFCSTPGRVAIIACGPEEFAYDVRTAVAAEQLGVARGSSAMSEVYLHAENYSW
ncbi:hypothetical protein AURDEDRAFT_115677 [Auricularia subglabra TFB-10046 SS5]|uniref:ferric-chelate reductase (NADPH) n=1 Tax=Auricularia subglabra (strain TFB-10046 / SS5) TaxID=717982 RepID=J0LK10_AURST|nr:hypothetical protein AURDEDRAFT_115677 [Auricularia subglabra TFB-10046 SS5]